MTTLLRLTEKEITLSASHYCPGNFISSTVWTLTEEEQNFIHRFDSTLTLFIPDEVKYCRNVEGSLIPLPLKVHTVLESESFSA